MPLSSRQSWFVDGRTLPLYAGAAIAAFGLLVLIGRISDVIDTSHVLPRGTSAIMFVAAGLALCAAAGQGPRSGPARRILALVVLGVAVFCVFEQLTPGPTLSPLGDGGGVSPVPTAAAFFLAGVGLLLYTVPPAGLSYLPVLAAGLIVLLAIDGYSLGLRPSSSALAGTSPGTLIGLTLLLTGILALTPHLPPFAWLADSTAGARLARLLVPTIAVAPLVLGVVLTRWEDATGLSENVGIAVIVAALTTTLTSITAITIRGIDRAERRLATVRAAADEAVRERERRFRLLATEMPVGVVSRDEAGEVDFVNEEAFAIFGLPRDSRAEDVRPDLLHPDDLERGMAAMRHTMATGEPYELELRVFRVDGDERRVVFRGTRHNDENGAFSVYLTTLLDVTEQRQAQAAERKVSEEFRVAFDQAPIGILVLDLLGQNIRVNDALCALTGRTAEWILGSAPLAMVHPEDMGLVTAAFQTLGREADSLQLDHRWVHGDGHTLWVDCRVTLVRDEHGRSDHVMAQLLDITEQRTHEERLQHLAEHDALTGLLNRRGFEAQLSGHVARVRRYGEAGSLLLLDLDGFKLVNDTLGHAAGDALLIGVAGALTERLREGDVIGRLGGDEFAVLLPHEAGDAALEAAQAIVDVVQRNATAFGHEVPNRVTVSVGVANFEPGLSSDEMLSRGDRAMYAAKASGKNRAAAYAELSTHQRVR